MTAIIRPEKLTKSNGNVHYFDEFPISPEVVAQVVSKTPVLVAR